MDTRKNIMLGNNRVNDSKLFILKLKSKDSDKHVVPVHFEISEKVEGKWVVTNQTKDVSGDITKIELKEREWEGETYPTVQLYIEDREAKETYLLDLRYNMLSRSLFNTLLSLESFDGISVGVYDRKKGDESFPAVSVRQHDKLVNWKHKIDELPKVEMVKVGKKEHPNFDNLNDFFTKGLEELSSRIGKEAPAVKKPAAPAPEPEEGEEIPF